MIGQIGSIGRLGLGSTRLTFSAPSLSLITHGDSITSNGQPIADITQNWSRLLRTAIQARQSITVNLTQRGIGGHSYNYAWPSSGNPNTLGQDAVLNIDPLASPDAILCVFAGTNGIWLAGNSAATEAAAADAYCAARIAAGFTPANIYFLGMLPRETLSLRVVHDFNTALRDAVVARGCRFVDTTAIPEFFEVNTTFLPDQIHPTVAGHDMLAEHVYDAIYSPAWTPATLATARSLTLAAWYDASDTATLFQDAAGTIPALGASDPVGRWNDKSGAGRHVSQSTAGARPIRSTYGSRPAVNFANSPTAQFLGGPASGLPSRNFTYCMAAAVPVGNMQFFASSSATTADGFGIRAQAQGLQTENAGALSAPTSAVGPTTMAVGFPGLRIFTGSRFARNNAGATGVAANNIRIGLGFGNGFAMNGPINEIVMFSSILNGVDLMRMDRYLRTRYGYNNVSPSNSGFIDQLNAVASSTVTSNTITIAGLPSGAYVPTANLAGGLAAGVSFSINGGAFSSGFRYVQNGDTLQCRVAAPSGSGQIADVMMIIGSRLYPWRVRTA